jgi:hypothetical protein
MKYLVFTLLVVVAVWYFFIRADTGPVGSSTHAVPLSSEKQLQALLAAGNVDAGQLAAICSAAPEVCAKYLRGKQIRIEGSIAEIRTSGMEGRRADLLLNGASQRKLVLVCDLDQYSGEAVNFRYLGKFQVVGTELLYLLQRNRTLTKKVVTTQGAAISQFCALKNLGASIVEFQMVNGPMWAGAETNQ